MIILMTTWRRPQQRYDHRLRELVRGTRNVTIATDLGVPRSTARGWLRETPKVVVSLDATNLTPSELQQEIVALRRRVRKLTALRRLALALRRSSGFTLAHERLRNGRDKTRILRALDRAREFVPLRAPGLGVHGVEVLESMSEAWWRSLTHQWLFLHSLDSVTTVRRLVAFYVYEHNSVLPHSAFRGQTPDEMYFGRGDAVPADLVARAPAARRARMEANRSAACRRCPSIDAAA
jgi:hypothetical protein